LVGFRIFPTDFIAVQTFIPVSMKGLPFLIFHSGFPAAAYAEYLNNIHAG
jgi:hypothetical protein